MTTVRHHLGLLATTGALAAAGLAAGASAASAAPAHTAPACGGNSLAVTRSFVSSGMGHSWMLLVYRNMTADTCTVTGFPGLDAIKANGHVLAHAKSDRDGTPVRTVTVHPDGYASAVVAWENFNGPTGGTCAFSRSVNTIVANTSRVHRLHVSVSRCGLEVQPTVAGTPMYPHYGAAQQDWLVGSTVDAADMGTYFTAAADELDRTDDFPTQVSELQQLASMPDTGLTHEQKKEVRADTKDLDQFFATPGLYR